MTAPQPALRVGLSGALGAFAVDASFDVATGGITALYGPSGSGKTTLLRCIAGLERLHGHVRAGGDVWQDSDAGVFVAPHRRHVGYVFQEPSLFPHLSVRQNLLYGAERMENRRRAGIALDDVVDLLGIEHLMSRATIALSGGERQRVAVGRALLANPRVLLMDEPLSALDRATKDELLPYFEALHGRLSIPILYVTHDMAEIEQLADTLVLIENGRVRASGPLRDLRTDLTLGLAHADHTHLDEQVTLSADIVGYDTAYDLTEFAVAGAKLLVPGTFGAIGTKHCLRVASGDVDIVVASTVVSPTGVSPDVATTVLNCVPARITRLEQTRRRGMVLVTAALGATGGGACVQARITTKAVDQLRLVAGKDVMLQIKCHVC